MIKKKIVAVIGARPQFIKHAPLELQLRNHFDVVSIHTGQHYDENMSSVFFNELGIQRPNYFLKRGGLSNNEMTAKLMLDLESLLYDEGPSAVLVYGDTNSTLSGALTSVRAGIPVIHVESGLRSFNRSMPEEINRVMTDHISSLLFAPTLKAVENLKNEGIKKEVYLVGDVMLDSFRIFQDKILTRGKNGFRDFILLTLHRPYNVDDLERLTTVLDAISTLGSQIIFPAHPRTKQLLNQVKSLPANITVVPPAGYFQMMEYLNDCQGLITDSGGMQKEAYFAKKKCLTIRSETEWVETLTHNWNHLVFDLDQLNKIKEFWAIRPGFWNGNLYGNGKSSEEMTQRILEFLS